MTPALQAAIAPLLEGVSRRELEKRAASLSVSYREGGTSACVADPRDALAYLVVRAPATHAAAHAVFERIAEVLPDFAPASLLDVGAGPGTAAVAARDCWPSLTRLALVEPNAVFRDLAARLLPQALLIAGDLWTVKSRAQLVCAGYVLAELPQSEAARAALELWQAAEEMLVLVEPGTPAGFARIRAARAALTGAGGHVAAPCTHDQACPLKASAGESRSDKKQTDWCHFSQRLARSRDHLTVKGASAPYEDERYAYVAVSRMAVAHGHAARIIKPKIEARPGITLPLCAAEGLRNAFIARRDKDAFRAVRRQDWGDIFTAEGQV